MANCGNNCDHSLQAKLLKQQLAKVMEINQIYSNIDTLHELQSHKDKLKLENLKLKAATLRKNLDEKLLDKVVKFQPPLNCRYGNKIEKRIALIKQSLCFVLFKDSINDLERTKLDLRRAETAVMLEQTRQQQMFKMIQSMREFYH